jgi:sporulation integral membrane protein YlbJ
MFVKTVRKSAIIKVLLLLGCIAWCWLLISWPHAAASGISRGLSICSSIIIPSLFPFLVLAGFAVKSGLCDTIGRFLEKPTRLLFRLPGCCAPGILISFIGGYPTGGIAVGQLLEQGSINKSQAQRMLCFCVNGGPAFIISAVGAGMMGEIRSGVILYCAHIAASLILGLIQRIGVPSSEAQPPARGGQKFISCRLSPAAAFVESVNGACQSLLMMCGFIVIFAALLSIFDACGFVKQIESAVLLALNSGMSQNPVSKIVSAVFSSLLEVSSGCVESSGTGAATPVLLGMALGWGGLSIHCQIAATLHGKGLVTRGFFISRFLHALLGGTISLLLFRYIPAAKMAFKPAFDKIVIPYSYNPAASAALLALCGLFLLAVSEHPAETPLVFKGKKRKKYSRNKEANMV